VRLSVAREAEIEVRNVGKTYRLSRFGVSGALASETPERIGKYGVIINGKEFPIRQALAKATGTSKIEWNTTHAYQILRKLGFELHEH
jgi:5-methylcytosine-specific restriction protein B